ncbi:MAG: hypothetical protein DRP10_00770 [Candidatus Aenigmatarchaeota archaeon]|nr:MAG: hypothetical protein DRP10_00770 [Candidatus Aenigmarchaeota archaeon]
MDKEILLNIGKKKGLKNREHIEKDYFQDKLLYYIFKLSNNLVFKGGTALYKLYNMPRFSEDLDFTLLDPKENTEDKIVKIAEKLDAEINIKKLKTSLLFKLRFNGILTSYNTVRIDVSLRNKVLLGFNLKNYVPDYIDIKPFSLKILKLKEMVAEKIHSLLARKNARDLYDLFFLLRISEFDKKLAKEKLKIFGMRFNSNLIKKRINEIKPIWEVELKPFVLEELPDFNVVKDFVIKRLVNSR